MTHLRSNRAPTFWQHPTEHRRMLADRANACLALNGSERMEGPLELAEYTEVTPSDTRPDATTHAGSLIYTTDTDTMWYSDGVIWWPITRHLDAIVQLNVNDTPAAGGAWHKLTQFGTVVRDPLSLWDGTNQQFDLSGLAYARFVKMHLQIEFENTAVGTNQGVACGIGVNGSNPTASPLEVSAAALIGPRTGFAFTVLNCSSPEVPVVTTDTFDAWIAVVTPAQQWAIAGNASWFQLEVYA